MSASVGDTRPMPVPEVDGGNDEPMQLGAVSLNGEVFQNQLYVYASSLDCLCSPEVVEAMQKQGIAIVFECDQVTKTVHAIWEERPPAAGERAGADCSPQRGEFSVLFEPCPLETRYSMLAMASSQPALAAYFRTESLLRLGTDHQESDAYAQEIRSLWLVSAVQSASDEQVRFLAMPDNRYFVRIVEDAVQSQDEAARATQPSESGWGWFVAIVLLIAGVVGYFWT